MTTTFATFLDADRGDPRARRLTTWALALAIAVHALALAGAILHGGWRVDEISPPAIPLTLVTFKPPPPPLGGAGERTTPRPTRRMRARPTSLVQPQKQVAPAEPEISEKIPGGPDSAPGDGRGDPEGHPDGTGTGTGEPTRFVAPNVAVGQLAIDPQAEPYRVKLPPVLARSGMRLWALLRLCVTREGDVEKVTILRSNESVLDPLLVATLARWRYRPYSVDGRPVPFCTNVRYEITAQ